MNMLEKIQSQLEHLSKSERKVAEVILASPDNAIHSSIAAMALEANVSEPTVNRFCRSMDTRGFPDFKRHCCKVSDEAAFCLIQRPYISKTLLTRRISPRGSP